MCEARNSFLLLKTPVIHLQITIVPFTLPAINNVCAKCINSFPSVEETISLRGSKRGKAGSVG